MSADLKLRGIAETRTGEKVEGWMRIEGATLIVDKVDGSGERRLAPGELRVANMHLAGPGPQRSPGLLGNYHKNVNFAGPPVQRIDRSINFNWASNPPLPDFPPDNFSVRWLGDIKTLNAGDYHFHTSTDDGARLWIDGKQLIDDWTNHPETERTASLKLEAERHYAIRLECFDGASQAVARLAWTPPGAAKAIVPEDRLSHSPSLLAAAREKNGLLGSYYRGQGFGGNAIERVDTAIDFIWNGRAPIAGLGVNDYSVRWRGEVVGPINGAVTFTTRTSDGARLWVGGQQLVDKWLTMAATEHTGQFNMQAGKRYPIVMEYFQAEGDAEAKLFWTGAGLARQIVPSAKLFATGIRQPTVSPGRGVILVGGSFVAGTVIGFDDKTIELTYGDGDTLRVPLANTGGIQLRGLDPAILAGISTRRRGCLLHNGEYLESRLVSMDASAVEMHSALFGKKRYPLDQVSFIKFHDFEQKPAPLELQTRSGSRLRADWLKLDGQRALVKDNSVTWIKLAPEEVTVLYGLEQEAAPPVPD